MEGAVASAGSCTMPMPPLSLIATNPADPSFNWPVRTIPTTRRPKAAAAERKSGSIAGLLKFSFGPRSSLMRSSSTIMCRSGGAT